MSRIKIDIDTLRSCASTMSGHISDYESLNSRFESLSASITDSWKGSAGQSYATKMNSYLQQAVSLVEIMNQFKKYAEDAADNFDEVDAACASRIRQSF